MKCRLFVHVINFEFNYIDILNVKGRYVKDFQKVNKIKLRELMSKITNLPTNAKFKIMFAF